MNCRNHADKQGEYYCLKCRQSFCLECINVRQLSDQFVAYICRGCGGKLEYVHSQRNRRRKEQSLPKKLADRASWTLNPEKIAAQELAQMKRSFWGSLPGVIVFPLKGWGVFCLALFTFLFWGCDWVLNHYRMPGLLLMTLVVTYFILFLFKVSEDSTRGSTAIKSLPGVAYWVDFVEPSVYVGMSILFCFAPLSTYFIFTQNFDLIFLVLWSVGMFFFPMAYVCVVLMRRPQPFNPLHVLAEIFRSLSTYLFMCLLIIFLIILQLYVTTEYLSGFGVSSFALNQLTVVYIWIVSVRLLGIFSRAIKSRLYPVEGN